MSKIIASLILKIFGWHTTDFPNIDKCVVGVAPHTSMWDFLWGRVFLVSKSIKPKILIKKEMFTFPLGTILKGLGGVPVDRSKPKGLTDMVVNKMKSSDKFVLAITPEGTRAKTNNWKKGFIHIARAADVPIVVGFIDYKNKKLGVLDIMSADGDVEDIMCKFKAYYKNIKGKHPERFDYGHNRKETQNKFSAE